jgi:hypothetical protein
MVDQDITKPRNCSPWNVRESSQLFRSQPFYCFTDNLEVANDSILRTCVRERMLAAIGGIQIDPVNKDEAI